MANVCRASERTRDIAECILAGEKVTADGVINKGHAWDRQQANNQMTHVKRYLRRHYPDIPVGYVPSDNGKLGTYQKLSTEEEVIAATRRSFILTRGYVRSSGYIVANAPLDLSKDSKARWAVAVQLSFAQLMAQFATVTMELIGASEPNTKKQLLKDFRRQLGAGDGSNS